MSTAHTVIDNFLDLSYFQFLQQVFKSNSAVAWRLEPFVSNDFTDVNPYEHYFVCPVYEQFTTVEPQLQQHLMPLFAALDVKALVRVRALLYPNQGKQLVHGKHIDSKDPVKACVFYLNTNNGFTELEDGTKIQSIENRALIFNGNVPHNSATCTDDKVRLVLNINYF